MCEFWCVTMMLYPTSKVSTSQSMKVADHLSQLNVFTARHHHAPSPSASTLDRLIDKSFLALTCVLQNFNMIGEAELCWSACSPFKRAIAVNGYATHRGLSLHMLVNLHTACWCLVRSSVTPKVLAVWLPCYSWAKLCKPLGRSSVINYKILVFWGRKLRAL